MTEHRFEADQVEDMIRDVIESKHNMIVQQINDPGSTCAVFEEHTNKDKRIYIQTWCRYHPGPYKVYSPKSST